MKTKVGVLTGGSSIEREVSLWSGNAVLEHLDRNKYDVTVYEIPPDKDLAWVRKIVDNPPDIIVSALHGGIGENGAIQGFLDVLGIPYIGSKTLSSAVCMDKAFAKMVMRSNHIPVIDGVFMRKNEDMQDFEDKITELGFPLIVKPNSGGSSIGISVANDFDELEKSIDIVKSYNDDVLMEKYIHGNEITCGLIETENGLSVLTLLDISTENQFSNFKDKYEDSYDLVKFSAMPEYLQTMIKEIAKKVFTCLNCHGYGRVDMIVCEEQVYVLEMNTLPGLTSHSLVPMAISKDSTFGELLDKLISYERGRK